MGSNGNGTKMVLWVFAVIVFPTLFFIGNNVIANENKSQDRDAKLREDLNICVKEQMITNQQILVALARIESDLKSKGRAN